MTDRTENGVVLNERASISLKFIGGLIIVAVSLGAVSGNSMLKASAADTKTDEQAKILQVHALKIQATELGLDEIRRLMREEKEANATRHREIMTALQTRK